LDNQGCGAASAALAARAKEKARMNRQPIENYGQTCSICGADYDGWGQSAEPVNDAMIASSFRRKSQMRKESGAA
jgi:hypothetical protein